MSRSPSLRWAMIPGAIVLCALVSYMISATDPGHETAAFAMAFVGAALATFGVLYAYSQDRSLRSAQELRVPSLPLAFCVGSFVALVLAPLPTVFDQRYMRVGWATRYYPLALLVAGASIAMYSFGARAIRAKADAITWSDSVSPPGFLRALFFVFLVLYGSIWALRLYFGARGYFSAWTTEDQPLVDDTRFGFLAMLVIRWTLIPFAEYFRSRSGSRGRIVWGLVSLGEVGAYIISNERTGALLAGAQLGIARACYEAWSRRRVIVTTGAVAALFFFLVNPAVYLMREGIVAQEVGVGNQVFAYADAFGRSIMATAMGQGRALASEYTERDAKGRMNGLDYLGTLAGASEQGVLNVGWGEYTLRNMAALVPSFWRGNDAGYAVSNAKFDLADRMGVPKCDYLQTAIASAFADFWWCGALVMFLAGLFDGWLWCMIAVRWRCASIRIAYYSLLPTYLWPVEYVADHFLGKFRFLGLLLVPLYLFERYRRRRWAGASGRAEYGNE